MANAVNWSAVSSASVATTEMNSLGNTTYNTCDTTFNNSTTQAQYGKIVIYLASLTPTAGGYIGVYMSTAPDGTNQDHLSSENPGAHKLIGTIPLHATAAARYVSTGIFQLEPFITTFYLYNASGVAFASSGNTVTLYYWNDEIQ